jgi:hypothetical protein
MRVRLAAVGLLVVAALLLPAAARADGITATCTAGGVTTGCSSAWYTTDVTVAFILPAGSSNPQGCGNQTVNSDTSGTTFTCTVAVSGTQCCRLDVTIKRDATAPTAGGIAADRGPDANGWYNHPVTVTVTGSDAAPGSGLASCTTVSYAGPNSGSATVSGTCRDNAGNVSAPQSLGLKYDGTPPTITPAPARGADSNGWYNHAVAVTFNGSDGTSGIDSCSSGSYSGPDSGSASVSGTCRDVAGNTASASFGLQYDATAPSVTGAATDRPPDVDGWYNHQVVVTFAGSDATSGIASCDAVAYSKPDDPTAAVAGRCRDVAGNVSAPGSFGLKYDSTPPKLTELAADAADRAVSLKWKDSKDVVHLTIQRGAATIYNGKPVSSFADKQLRNGVRYTYTLTGTDAAGNPATVKIVARPAPPLLAPRQEAHVSGGVTLRWRAVPKASYYNVQVWLKGVKVLTTWPTKPSLRLAHLPPGRYVWHVWPGFGPLTKHRFGSLVGTSSFVVMR